MTTHSHITGARGRVFSGRVIRLVSVAAGALLLAACGNILDVDNPNNVVEDALNNPGAAEAIANGAGATVTRALTAIYAPYGAVSDELTYVGSRDAYGYADRGEVSDPFNEFSDAAFPYVSEARYTTSNAVRLLKTFQDDGTLENPLDLGRALLYQAIIFTSIGEIFDDFVIEAEKQSAGLPLGEGNMYVVFDSAIAQATEGLAVVQGITGDAANDTRIALTMVRARARHSKAIWQKLNGADGTPAATPVASPLVNDAQADADAAAALQLAGVASDFKFRFTPLQQTLGFPIVGNDLNNRLELRAGDTQVTPSSQCRDDTCDQYVIPGEAGNTVLGAKYEDPVDNIVDPVLAATITECCIKGTQNGGGDLVPLTMVSVREMLLIRAEHALANGDAGGFTGFINQLRGLNSGLSNYNGTSPAPDAMLQHERFVNLFLQGRRLMDMHRFGIKSLKWIPSAEAYGKACFFPIMNTERQTHPQDFVLPLCRPAG